jgi:Xaa-Pro aminopeptidase
MMFANADAGGSFTPMVGWASGPSGRALHHRVEQPTFRTFGEGDVLLVEIEGRWGGYIAQIDQTAAIGSAKPELHDAAKLAFEAFDRVMDRLRPGVTVRELIAAARVTGMGGRLVTGLGGHGRGTGDDGPLLVARRQEQADVLDIAIEEDCSFVIKPSASLDGSDDYARWGDTVVVTSSGAKRLGTRPQEMRILR